MSIGEHVFFPVGVEIMNPIFTIYPLSHSQLIRLSSSISRDKPSWDNLSQNFKKKIGQVTPYFKKLSNPLEKNLVKDWFLGIVMSKMLKPG